jgi:hypothetical protein
MSIGNDNKVYDENGFDANGYDENGYDADGFDKAGYDESGYDAEGYDCDGYDANGYNSAGWDSDGLHEQTGTEWDEDGYTVDGSEYNSEGYNQYGYDEDGYNEDGEDSDGRTREDAERREMGEEFDGLLVDYGGDVLEICEWKVRPGQAKELLAGHEIEMFSNDVDIDDVGFVGSQLWKAYRNHNPQASGCAVGKHDGSLEQDDDEGIPPGGFETVTVPLTREQTYGIFESFDVLGDKRCSAWNRGQEVGHHIHVSRSAISGLTLGKLGVFMNLPANRKFLTAIAQRPPIYNDFEDGKKLSKPKNRMRHSVLNLTEHTVEFRLFKANLKTQCILKNYEFCIAAIKFCRSTSHQDLNRLDFLKFVAANRKEFGYLHTFLLNHGVWSDAYRAFLPANVAFPKEQGQKPAVDVSTGV